MELEIGEGGALTLGPLTLWIDRRPHEWRLAHSSTAEALSEDFEARWPIKPEVPRQGAKLTRFVSDEPGSRLNLKPALAERAFIVRPEHPLWVLPQQKVCLFVTTPLWLQVSTGEGEVMLDLPTYPPRQTWFGPNQMEGELCYASRTRARVDLELLRRCRARANTAVHIQNQGREPLRMTRLRLPVTKLAIFEARSSGAFWTQTVSVVRSTRGKMDDINVKALPPGEAGEVSKVAEARERGPLTALGQMLGWGR